MRHLRITSPRVAAIASLLATLGCGGDTTPDPGELDDDAIADIREAVEQSLAHGHATGCSVAVWRDGEVIYAEGFGTRDEAGHPVTAGTLFQIGSDTKKLTAITLLQLVDRGALSLDQTVGELLPALELAQAPGHLDTVTVHQLLSHQTGLYDYTPWSEHPRDAELREIAQGRFAANEFAMLPAGLAFTYDNPDYSLAGLLVEELGGRRWPDVVIDDVARPLGMEHTYARRDDMLAMETNVASGYGPIQPTDYDDFEPLQHATIELLPPDWTTPQEHADNAFLRPAGLVWSTATDMARLGGFLIEGERRVLSQASRAALVRAHVATLPGAEPDELGYGYGLFVTRGLTGPHERTYDVPVLSHGGNTLTMSSTFMVLPEQRVAVSILANSARQDTTAVAAIALEHAAKERLPEPGPPLVLLPPPRSDLSVYTGRFEDRSLGEVTLALDGGDLTLEIPALDALGFDYDRVLVPTSRDVFRLTVADVTIDLAFYDGEEALEYGVTRWFVLRRTTTGS